MSDLSTPDRIQQRLEAIDHDLAVRQNAFENAARRWFRIKREQEHANAVAFVSARADSVTERRETAKLESSLIGAAEEAEWEALKGVVGVLQTRAMIGMALLKSQGRA